MRTDLAQVFSQAIILAVRAGSIPPIAPPSQQAVSAHAGDDP